MAAERLGELCRLAVADAARDVGDRQVGALQQRGRVLHAHRGHLVAERAAGELGEHALELALGGRDLAGHVAEREVGLTMAREDLELMPLVDDDGALAGVMTERTLARRYIRETREVTSLADRDLASSDFLRVFKVLIKLGMQMHVQRGGDSWVITVHPRGSQPRRLLCPASRSASCS